MQADITIQPQVPSITSVEQHYDHAAQQMSRACGIPLDEAEGWIATAIRRAGGIRE